MAADSGARGATTLASPRNPDAGNRAFPTPATVVFAPRTPEPRPTSARNGRNLPIRAELSADNFSETGEKRTMRTYRFCLRFAAPGRALDAATVLPRLGDGVSTAEAKRGRMAFDFVRGARTAEAAMLDAIREVQAACTIARFVEAGPDLVGLAQLPRLAGCSRQNLRMRALRDFGFPLAAHEGHPELFHLVEVLRWVRLQRHWRAPAALVEVADAARQLNLARQLLGVPGWRVPRRLRLPPRASRMGDAARTMTSGP